MAPSAKVFLLLGITKSGSTFKFTPIPSHSSQAPYGLLNEKSLGSISSMVKPLSGQANFDEKTNLFYFSIFFWQSLIFIFNKQ